MFFFASVAYTGHCQLLSSYTFSAFTGTYTPISGTIAPVTGGTAIDDAYSNAIPIGFNFTYCGTTYNTVSIDWNGWVALGENIQPGVSYNNDLSNDRGYNLPRPILAPLWTDLYYASDSQISYRTNGVVGSRTFIVQWKDAGFYNSSIPREDIQLILHEDSGVIDFAYRKISTDTYSINRCAVGITGGAGVSYTSHIPFWSLNNPSAAPYPSMTTETTNIVGQPATNLVYRWTPCAAGLITGNSQVCVGGSVILTDTVAGGTWSSGSVVVATVDTLGVVSTISPGTVVITYTQSVSCGAFWVVTINSFPVLPAINGALQLCVGASIILTDSIAGGSWSCKNTNAIAGYLPGSISGISTGIDTVVYTIENICGAATITKVVTVNPLPVAITGTTGICVDGLGQLYDSTTGGVWSSAGTGYLFVNSATGELTGDEAGEETITYTGLNGCSVETLVTVVDCILSTPHIAKTSTDVSVQPNPNNGTFAISGNWEQPDELISLRIIDMTGRIVYNNKIQTTNGNINETIHMNEALARGTYLLELFTASQREVYHFVVE